METKHIPNFYRPMFPGGPCGPLRWQDEVSGVLPKAVIDYFTYKTKQGPPLLRAQFKLVIEYAAYYVNAPCWDDNPHHDDETQAELAALRERVKHFTPETEQAFDDWIHDCLEVGLDIF